MITPADGASAPGPYAGVPVSGMDIQAPQEDLAAMAAACHSEAMGRQPQADALLTSDQGYGEFSITGGYTGDWPGDVTP